MSEGIVDTSEVFIDGTPIKAHANRNKKESAEVMDQVFESKRKWRIFFIFFFVLKKESNNDK
jgi:hypothetical protein